MAKINIFCAKDQVITEHDVTVEPINGEILATCQCGRFLKFPPNVTSESFTALIKVHQESNKGQVSLEVTQTLVDDIAAELAKPVV